MGRYAVFQNKNLFFYQKKLNYNSSTVDNIKYYLIFLPPIILLFYIIFLSFFKINYAHWCPLLSCLILSFFISLFLFSSWKCYKCLGISLFILLFYLQIIGHSTNLILPIIIIFTLNIIFNLNKLFIKQEIYFKKTCFLALLCCGFFLTLILLQRSELGYAQPFAENNLFKDTLFHSSIASMLKNFNIASTGLHGIQPIYYHTGSHSIFSAISSLTKVPVLQSYNYFYPLVFVPLLLTVFLCLAEEVFSSENLKDIIIRSFVLVTIVLALRNPIFYRAQLSQNLLLSESYSFSIISFACLISVIICLEKSKLAGHKLILNIFLILIFIQTITFKISTPFVFFGILITWFLFSQSQSFLSRLAILIVTIFCFMILFSGYNKSASTLTYSLFSSINTVALNIDPDHSFINFSVKFFYFIIIHLLFSNILICYWFFCQYFKKSNMIFSSWLILGIFFSSIVGIVPGLFLSLPGGAESFFSNVIQVLSIPFLLCIPSHIFQNFKYNSQRYIFMFIFGTYATIFLFVFLPTIPKIILGSRVLISEMQKSQLFASSPYIKKLELIRDDKNTLNKLIYIPRTQIEFWNKFNCNTVSFLIPAIAERPGLFSYPDLTCHSADYGTSDYDKFRSHYQFEEFTNNQLLSTAKKLGFKGVIVVTKDKIVTIN